MFMNIDQNEVIMKSALFLTAALLTASPALAQTNYTALLEAGAKSAVYELAFQPGEKSSSDLFALGAAQVLLAVETAYQTRYRYGLSDDNLAAAAEVPFLRSAIPSNPNARPFEPEIIEQIFQVALRDLFVARYWLDQIESEDEVAVQIDLSALWIDINDNGLRDAGEAFSDCLSLALAGFDATAIGPAHEITVQFDAADAAWLSAYTHMLSGASELILALNPDEAIEAIMAQGQTLDAIRGNNPTLSTWVKEDDLPVLDIGMAMFAALEGPVDPKRSRAAHQHFLDGLADNRIFWSRLSAETDNTMEFIPNRNQTSALMIEFPEGIDTSWQAVLQEAEDILTGELLLPHWRLGTEAGLNLKRLFQKPPEIDVIGMLHGYALADYAERGPAATFETLEEFDQITGGNSGFFAFTLN